MRAAYNPETTDMKFVKQLLSAILLGTFSFSSIALAADGAAGAKVKPYPLKTCLVSGETLGTMGAPYVYRYKDQEIKFCCKGCLKDFNKNPEKFLKKLGK